MNISVLSRVFATAFMLAATVSLAAQTDYSQPYIVSTVAGVSNVGSVDGSGEAARFNRPEGIARDTSGNFYISDTRNHTIRKITPAGVVTTIAGFPGKQGVVDGAGSSARFSLPRGLAVNASGIVYVADGDGRVVRKITADGAVSTLAGAENGEGLSRGGAGENARFRRVEHLVLDSAGNIVVSDLNLLRRITPTGEVTTLSASSDDGASDPVFGVPNLLKDAKLAQISGLAYDSTGNLYVGQSSRRTLLKLGLDGYVQVIAGQPGAADYVDGPGSTARFGDIAALTTDASGVL